MKQIRRPIALLFACRLCVNSIQLRAGVLGQDATNSDKHSQIIGATERIGALIHDLSTRKATTQGPKNSSQRMQIGLKNPSPHGAEFRSPKHRCGAIRLL